MQFHLLAALTTAALVGACATETRTTVIPAAAPAADACSAYGYVPGTEGYRICAEREAAARKRGRMAAGYAAERIQADAQEACLSYGLSIGTERYERCLQREITYRRPG